MKKAILFINIFLFVAVAAFAQVDRSKRPDAGPARAPEIGEADVITMKNGMKIFVVENSKLPRVSMSLILDRDPMFEGEKAGYVEMAGDMIGRGTTNRPKDKLDAEVDFMGATLNSSATSIYAAGLSKYTEDLIEIMADVAMNPAFTQEEFDKAKEQFMSAIESGKDDPGTIMSNVYSALIYGKDHPYGEMVTTETVEAITLEDCKAYYNTYFKPNIAYVAVVGDVKTKKVKKLFKKYFGAWASAEVPTHNYEMPASIEKTMVAFVDRQASVQSEIRIGNPIVLHPGDADIDAMRVMNTILGGGSMGRLYNNLRETHGYTYGAYSSFGTDELVSAFTANASVRNEVTDSAVHEFLFELDRIRTGDVTEEEMAEAKAYIMGSFGRSLERPGTIASFAISTARYNLPADYYANYLKRVESVTKEDIKRVAEKYIAGDNLLITVVGKGQDVAPPLERFGGIAYFDIYGNPTEAPSFLTMPEGVTAKDVIDNYISALGDKDVVENLSAYQMNLTAEMEGVPAPISITVAAKTPDYYMDVQEIPNMFKQKRVYAKGKGTMESPMGNGPIEGEDLERLKQQASVVFEELNYFNEGYTVELEGQNKLDGMDVYQVMVTKPSGDKVREYYNIETGLKYREESEMESPQGPMTVSTTIDAYEEYDGIKWPSVIYEAAGPQKITSKLTEVKTGKAVSTSIFK